MEVDTTTASRQSSFRDYLVPVSIIIAGIIVANAVFATQGGRTSQLAVNNSAGDDANRSALEEAVLPKEGVTLPAVWGDLGARLVDAGAIDPVALKEVYKSRGAFPVEYNDLLAKRTNGALVITEENAGYLLNLLWAFGLANANPILADKTEMMNPAYGGAGNFASTGGWTIAKGNAMTHYSKHALVVLTPEQQELVDRVSQNIYRPCCGNSTHFPDCNHGMAMLGLLELMASQDVSEKDMYKAALAVNSYWFPGTYLTVAEYMQSKGTDWKKISPKEILGSDYSSNTGYARIISLVPQPQERGGSGGCGVEAGAAAPRQQSGCGI